MTAKFEHDYKVGDILYHQWGYEQTNVYFYQVVGITPKCVKIRRIKSKSVKSYTSMSGECVPCKDEFRDDDYVGSGKTAKVGQYGVILNSKYHYTAYKWDGRPVYESSYY